MGKKGDNSVKETPYQREIAKIAAEKWGKYQEKYVPIENEYMQRVDAMGEQWQENLATGEANKQVQESFGTARDQIEGQLFKGGINPNSGKFNQASTALESAKASSAASGIEQAKQMQKDRHISGIKSVVDMGQGQAIDAQRGLTDVANDSAKKAADDAYSSYRNRADNRAMVGTGFGMAGAYGLDKVERKGA